MNEAMWLLFEVLAEGGSVNDIIKLTHEKIFDNPIMLFNASFRLLASASEEEINDPVWEYGQLYHCCSKESIVSFKNDKASDRLFTNGETFYYDTNLGAKIPRILNRIQIKGKTYGYLIIFYANGVFKKSDIDLANMVSQALGVSMIKRTAPDDLSQDIIEYTLNSLLEGNHPLSHEVIENVKAISRNRKPNFQVFYTCFTNQKDATYSAYIKQQIKAISSSIYCVSKDNKFAIICNFEKESKINYMLEAIKKVFSQYTLSFGASMYFSSLMDLNDYYLQAKNALEIGELIDSDCAMYSYSNYSFYYLLSKLPVSELENMLCTEYRILFEYDKKYHVDYVDTIIEFYKNSLNMTTTANALHIHRNTLTYRIEKIKELINYDFKTIEVLSNIYQSHLIKQYICAKKL